MPARSIVATRLTAVLMLIAIAGIWKLLLDGHIGYLGAATLLFVTLIVREVALEIHATHVATKQYARRWN